MEKIIPIAMAQSAFLPGFATQHTEVLDAPRHSALVRVTHWIHAASFIALLISGICILPAYPRMHWGETGTVGTLLLFDVPLPFALDLGLRGPCRYVHFLAARVCLFSGLPYVISGLYSQHFRKNLLLRRSDLGLRPILKSVSNHLRFDLSLSSRSTICEAIGSSPSIGTTIAHGRDATPAGRNK